MESAEGDFEIAQNCEVEQIGEHLKSIYYAFGIRKGNIILSYNDCSLGGELYPK